VTSVGENEEKVNTVQPPLLVFFSPSSPIVIATFIIAYRKYRLTLMP